MARHSQDAEVITIPQLSVQQAQALCWYYKQTYDRPDRYVGHALAITGIFDTYGFSAFEAIDQLIQNPHTPMLLFPVDPNTGEGKPMTNRHRIPEVCFRNPAMLFEAINAAEREHNRKIETNSKLSPADPKSGYSHLTASLKPVVLSVMPEDAEGSYAPPATAAAPITIGSFVPQPDGTLAQLLDRDGVPTLVPVAVAKPDRTGGASKAPQVQKVTPKTTTPTKVVKDAAPQRKGTKLIRGHEVA